MDVLNSIRGSFISSSTLIQVAFKQVLMSMSTTYMLPYAFRIKYIKVHNLVFCPGLLLNENK